MTLLPSFDPGTVPRASLAGSGDRASSGQPGTGSGQAQGFAALVGQPPEAAPALPESPPEGSAEASDSLPDVLAQMLRPLPGSAPQGGGPQPLAAEAEATDTLPDGLAQILQPVPGTALQDGTAQSVFAEGAPLPDAATETEIGTATDAAGAVMLVEAVSDLPGAPTLVAPHLPDAAQATTEDPPAAAENLQDGYGEGLAELGANGMASAQVGPAEPEPLGGVTSTTQSSAADKTSAEKSDIGKTGTARDGAELDRSAQGPDSAQPRIAPGPETVPAKPETIPALPPEVPRPVSLSVSLAPGPAPAQTAGPAAPPPLLSTAGPTGRLIWRQTLPPRPACAALQMVA